MRTDPVKENKWRKLLIEYKESNLTIKKFCELNEVKFYQFYYWRNKFDLKKPVNGQKSSNFIKVMPVKETPTNNYSLSIAVNNIKINVPVDFNAQHLQKILKIVSTVD